MENPAIRLSAAHSRQPHRFAYNSWMHTVTAQISVRQLLSVLIEWKTRTWICLQSACSVWHEWKYFACISIHFTSACEVFEWHGIINKLFISKCITERKCKKRCCAHVQAFDQHSYGSEWASSNIFSVISFYDQFFLLIEYIQALVCTNYDKNNKSMECCLIWMRKVHFYSS